MTKRMQMKQDLKDLTIKIRNGKSGRKPKNRTNSNEKDYNKLVWNRNKFRYIHIVYCLMRGRTIEEIERPREDNIAREDQIKKYIDLYSPEEMQEAA
jgi:hypothetical protein